MLADNGIAAAGIDAGDVASGAAGSNGGLLLAGLAAFHHDAARELGRRAATDWYHRTAEELERILDATPGAARRTGSLRIATDKEELADCHEQLRMMRADGLVAEEYEGREGTGLLFPADAVFNPLQRCRMLAGSLMAEGVPLFSRTRAVEVTGTRVSTESGVVHCRRVLVAVDGLLPVLLPELADEVKPLRLQMVATAPLPQFLPRPVYARYGFEYWQQLPDGRVAMGGFRDRGGPHEWTLDNSPGGEVQSQLDAYLLQLGISAPVTHRWAATVGYTAKRLLPVNREVRPGVNAIGGYNGTGNLVGAVVAREAAGRIIRELSA